MTTLSTTPINGKVAVVTGGGRGIGKACCLALARAGAKVVVAARREADVRAVAEEINAASGAAIAVAADLSQESGADALKRQTTAAFGDADILVNNAGVGKYGALATLTVADYDRIMNTNMRATFLCTRAFLPSMLEKKSGDIAFVASVAGLRGLPHETVYCASKSAQVAFAQALDYETREHGVKVSVLAPGGVNTDFAIGDGRTRGDPMLDDMMNARDVADAVVFAVSQPAKTRVFMLGMRPMNEPL